MKVESSEAGEPGRTEARMAGDDHAAKTATRRAVALGLPLLLGACAAPTSGSRFGWSDNVQVQPTPAMRRRTRAGEYAEIYGEREDGRFVVEAIDLDEIDPINLRREVAWDGREPAGTVVIDPKDRSLHLVREGGRAIRYGVGVGRAGFEWSGRATIRRKAEWPVWTPPREMTQRDAEAAKWAAGMPGGPENPLGARALYLFQGERDTLYRVHGTNDPSSIGEAMSSGCIRMLNHDVIDLYAPVPIGTPVVVIG